MGANGWLLTQLFFTMHLKLLRTEKHLQKVNLLFAYSAAGPHQIPNIKESFAYLKSRPLASSGLDLFNQRDGFKFAQLCRDYVDTYL